MSLITNLVSTISAKHVLSTIRNNIQTSSLKRLNFSNSSNNEARKRSIRSTLYYVTAAGVVTVGLSYAAVPLYRLFCQAYSYGGTVATGHDAEKVGTMSAVKSKPIKIKFNADTAASMRWNFKPQQTEITVSLKYFIKRR